MFPLSYLCSDVFFLVAEVSEVDKEELTESDGALSTTKIVKFVFEVCAQKQNLSRRES